MGMPGCLAMRVKVWRLQPVHVGYMSSGVQQGPLSYGVDFRGSRA